MERKRAIKAKLLRWFPFLSGWGPVVADLFSFWLPVIILLYLNIGWLGIRLRLGEDVIRRNLDKKLWGIPVGQWPKVRRWLLLLAGGVPGVRRRRCLVTSVLAFRYLRYECPSRLCFVLGVRRPESGAKPEWHAWLDFEGEPFFDSDPLTSYTPVFTFPPVEPAVGLGNA